MKRSETYWKAIGTVGLEHLVLVEQEDAVRADGLILRHHNGQGLRVWYQLQCDSTWKPRELVVDRLGEHATELRISADGNGNWFNGHGQPLEVLQGCIDVDLMATPFTNTLAIRHLGLRPGESKEIDVAYVTVPDLDLRRATQRYTCLAHTAGEAHYRYESLNSNFTAELVVDTEQLVVVYQGVWERVSTFKATILRPIP